jgi:hypothetical protein
MPPVAPILRILGLANEEDPGGRVNIFFFFGTGSPESSPKDAAAAATAAPRSGDDKAPLLL